MENKDLANIFKELSFFLEMDGVSFKPQAYERAALTLGRTLRRHSQIFIKLAEKRLLIACPALAKVR